ncbi:Down syndrome cell adhesion molecule-like protein Dscam2 [Pseudolycoriella hygida]|uniref:Down syndrome cell adhesion molecule-like protein Dscam2 n=1 Tax=Pseudolycoriella hygida TaxID=35572 RepID=A0A9Q0N2G7_9DIPT|nr:Down syndrome cell adhesion molecule-like protein Dscam2 [Pseudolycoriella hygida]
MSGNFCKMHRVRTFSLSPYDEQLTEYVASSNSFDTQGPTFTLEPPFRLEFTNTAGSRADCTVRGNPPPHVEWLDLDNNAVSTIQSNGSETFN